MSQIDGLTEAGLKTPKAAAIAGVIFSLLTLASFGLLWSAIPADQQASGAWLVANGNEIALALNLIPFAGIAFLWFIGVIRDQRWVEVAKELLPRGGGVAVPGGQVVFDLFLNIGFDAFHLTRARGVRLPGGRALFSGCDAGLSAEAVLASAGLCVSKKIVLDAEHGVDMSVWRAVRETARAGRNR